MGHTDSWDSGKSWDSGNRCDFIWMWIWFFLGVHLHGEEI